MRHKESTRGKEDIDADQISRWSLELVGIVICLDRIRH